MIHALPGMGADHRMFPTPWETIPELILHDWPPYAGQTSLREVARTIVERCAVRDGDALIGASLGGMVACEIARIRRLRALFLVGSAVHREEISPLLARLHPLAAVAPIDALKFSAGALPNELGQMFRQADPAFIRAMCRAIFAWPGLGHATMPVRRIHGRRDLVILPPDRADLLLDGGHLISITHASACVDFIRQQLRRLDATAVIRRCTLADVDAMVATINDAATAYRGVIPPDRWHEPYMPRAELEQEIADGVVFWGYEAAGELVGVMGIQDKCEVTLIRHAYVRTTSRNQGIGTRLLRHLEAMTATPILIGTWTAAAWAIRFYEKNGYRQLSRAESERLLRRYWRIPPRQVATSVVLAQRGAGLSARS